MEIHYMYKFSFWLQWLAKSKDNSIYFFAFKSSKKNKATWDFIDFFLKSCEVPLHISANRKITTLCSFPVSAAETGYRLLSPPNSRSARNRNSADADRGNFNLIYCHKLHKCVRALEDPWRGCFFGNKKEMWFGKKRILANYLSAQGS